MLASNLQPDLIMDCLLHTANDRSNVVGDLAVCGGKCHRTLFSIIIGMGHGFDLHEVNDRLTSSNRSTRSPMEVPVYIVDKNLIV